MLPYSDTSAEVHERCFDEPASPSLGSVRLVMDYSGMATWQHGHKDPVREMLLTLG